LLHAHAIRWAIENNLRIYDLCHGNEPYKYSLGAIDKRIGRLRIRRRSKVKIGRLDPFNVADGREKVLEFLATGRVDDAVSARRQLASLSRCLSASSVSDEIESDQNSLTIAL
jgi:CelD/BcsL family acetyltransferase involved in cellulose biosynthesis